MPVNLVDAVRAESGYPSDPTVDNSNIDVALLEQLLSVQLGSLGIPLINDGSNNGLLYLGDGAGAGVLRGYAYAPDANNARAASGAVTGDGVIDVDATTDPDVRSASVELTALLGQLGVNGLTDQIVDQVSLELGAIASEVTAQTGESVDSSYVVGDLQLVISSPTVEGLSSTITTAVGSLETTLNGIIGPDGAVQAALEQAVSLLSAVNIPGLVEISFEEPSLNATIALSAAVSGILSEPLVDETGPVTIDLNTGLITVDLQQLHADGLNDRPANTELLTGAEIERITTTVITLLSAVTGEATDAVNEAVETTDVNVSIATDVSALRILDVLTGTLTVNIDGTIADFLGTTETDPVLTLSSTLRLLGIPIELDSLLTQSLLRSSFPSSQPSVKALNLSSRMAMQRWTRSSPPLSPASSVGSSPSWIHSWLRS